MTELTERKIINNNAKKAASIADITCGLCQTAGLPLFLIRKSIVPSDYEKGNNWSNGMNPKELDGREPKEALEHHQYVYRLLREGFVYVMLKRVGSTEKEFLTYESLERGGFRFKPEREIEEKKPKPLSEKCVNQYHHIKALFLSIPNPEQYDMAWIAYSRHAWSDQTKSAYKLMDESKLSRFTQIIINKNSIANPSSLVTEKMPPRAFDTQHFVDKQRVLFESTITNNQSKKLLYPFRYIDPQGLKKELDLLNKQNMKVASIIVEDTLGLAEEFAYYRSQYVEPYLSAIRKADLNIENMITQQYQNSVDNGLAKDGKDFDSPLDLLIKAYQQYKDENQCEAEKLYKKTDYWKKFQDIYGLGIQTVDGYPLEAFLREPQPKLLQQDETFAACVVNDYKDAGILDKYFSEKNVYKRKILSCIDNYQNALLQFYHTTTLDTEKVIYTFRGGKYESLILDSYFNNSVPNKMFPTQNVLAQSLIRVENFDNNTMELIKLDDDIAKEKLRQFNALYSTQELGRKTEATHVEIYRYKGSGSKLAQKKFDEKWAEIKERLDYKRYETFKNENIQLYNELMDKVRKLSKDYFVYITWLAGDEPIEQSSSEKQGTQPINNYAIKLSHYNDNYFWQVEYPLDYSDTHLNFMTDIMKILKMDYLGTMTLDEQFGIWDRMFRNKNTLFFWPFYGDGTQDTLWSTLLKTHLTESQKLQGEHQLSTSDIINKSVDNVKSILGIDLVKSKIKDFLGLYNGLNSLAIEGFSNIPAKGLLNIQGDKGFLSSLSNKSAIKTNRPINVNLAQAHLQGSFRLLSGLSGEVVSFSVNRNNLKQVLNSLAENKLLILSSNSAKQTIQGTNGNSVTLSWNEPKGQVVIHQATGKGQFTFEAFLAGKNEEQVKKLAGALSQGDYSVLSELKDKIEFSQFKGANYHNIDSHLNEIVHKERATVYLENSATIAANAVLGVFEVLSFMNNLEQLNSQITGEEERSAIYRSLYRSAISGIQLSLEGLNSIIAIGVANSHSESALHLIAKNSTTLIKSAGVILSIWTIYDGISGIIKGIERASYGDVGGLGYIVASAFNVLSGVAAILAIFFPIFGLVAFMLGMISAFLLWLFRDKSESWTLIEKWMTRCYFGNAEHQEKLTPFPLNNYGTFYAINDYFCALTGATAVIQYDRDDNELFSASSRYDIPIHYSDGYTNPNNNAARFNKSVYISLVLPNFDTEESTFEGVLYIEPDLTKGRRFAQPNEEPIKVKFEASNENNMLVISNKNDIKLSTFLVRKSDELNMKTERYDYIKDEKNDIQSTSYAVVIKLGELYGLHKLALVVKYWQEGKVKKDKNGDIITINGTVQKQLPLLLTYHYKD